ncbi:MULTISPECIES: NlpC/P60 family protein [unclassified Tatumella]|uniref:C40 family peptidase n=1 Tax=unclassified Tatumella TaxID=2649542 RepID=UPI001BB0920D|nr:MULTISPECIES: NlpC/P60 family protein [unclassified Tatumella]MBS0857439.1 C40 family peptidase [Tatumella sp. JGM16]MBS0894414.1 C40 family peptidase [Tatumella sp. JGM130]MBS0913266.1 C40 family peptidase [Tatumella sp. JGM91]
MSQIPARKIITCLLFATLAGCSSGPKHAATADTRGAEQPDLIPVLAALHDQMDAWQGTRYQWGGTKLTGVDCSGFVWRTLKDRFNIPMERVTTRQLISMGQPVKQADLLPGDLVFFRIKNELHVGFYDTDRQFLHASVSRGVVRSSLNNPYWKSVYLEARRLPREYNSQITFNYSPVTG